MSSRRLVGAAPDPAAGHRRHAPPDGVGAGTADDLGVDHRNDENGERSADDDAEGAGKEHDAGFGSQPDDAGDVDAQRQQDEAGGQQVARGDEVELRLIGVVNTECREDRRQEVADEETRDDRVEALPEAVLAVRGHEHERQDRHQDPEVYGVVRDQRAVVHRRGILQQNAQV